MYANRELTRACKDNKYKGKSIINAEFEKFSVEAMFLDPLPGFRK